MYLIYHLLTTLLLYGGVVQGLCDPASIIYSYDSLYKYSLSGTSVIDGAPTFISFPSDGTCDGGDFSITADVAGVVTIHLTSGVISVDAGIA